MSQKSGTVNLYAKKFLGNVRRSIRKLYEEALLHHTQHPDPHSQLLFAAPGETSSEAQAPSSGLVSDLLASILNRYMNIPVEDLSHKECIDLLKILIGKTKKEPTPKKEERYRYITPEIYERIHQRTKNRDYSGNNLEDVEAIYREYAPGRA